MPRKLHRRVKGEGSITRLPSGKYRGRIDLGRDERGVRIRPSVTGDTKSAVAAELRELARQYADSGAPPNRRANVATVKDALDLLVETQQDRHRRGRIKARTVEDTEYRAKLCHQIENARLRDLTPRMIEQWASSLADAYSNNTARGAWMTLRQALNLARRDGLMSTQPMRDLEAPAAGDDEAAHATEQDVAVILAGSEPPWQTLWAVLAYTGMRPGEGRGLRWENVDTENWIVTVRESSPELSGSAKTPGSWRRIPLFGPARDGLADWWEQQGKPERGLVFPMAADRSNTARAFRQVAPDGLTPKSLRHGVATRLLTAGVPTHVVSSILGHSSGNVTQRVYAHSIESVEADALRGLVQTN